MNKLITLAVVGILTILVSCKVVTEDNSSNKAISVFKVANGDIGSWKELTDGSGYSGIISNLGDLLNGGKEVYEKNGIVQGFNQKLSIGASNERLIDAIVLEYATIANSSQTMKDLESAGYFTSKESITGYDDTIACIGKTLLSGCKAFAHFGNYFFVINASGYSVKADAIAAVEDYISFYKSKQSSLK